MVLGKKQIRLLLIIVAFFVIAAMISNGILRKNRVIAAQQSDRAVSSETAFYDGGKIPEYVLQ